MGMHPHPSGADRLALRPGLPPNTVIQHYPWDECADVDESSRRRAVEPAPGAFPLTPRLVATVGLHGSASTSVFNIVRELMTAAVGADQVLAVYGEDMTALPEPFGLDRRHVVLKTHRGSPAWRWLISLASPPLILSIRDPRDAVLSLMERFNVPLRAATGQILADCRCAELCADAGHVPLRYEDRYFAADGFAFDLSKRLGLDLPETTCREIGARYTTEGVRSVAANLDALPPGRAVKTDNFHFDTLTQIHRTHIGDGRVGKWRDRLDDSDGEALTRAFAPFLDRFGYVTDTGRSPGSSTVRGDRHAALPTYS